MTPGIFNHYVVVKCTLFIFLVIIFRHSAAVWGHEWKWNQINKKEDEKWTKRRKSGGSSFFPHLPGHSSNLESHTPPPNSKNIFYTHKEASAKSRRPSANLGVLTSFLSHSHHHNASAEVEKSSHSIDQSSDGSVHSHSINGNNPSHSFLQDHSRLCVFYDDESDVFVGEISESQWPLFAVTHDFRLMEEPGDDPLLESYLLETLDKHSNPKESLPDLTLLGTEFHSKASQEENDLLEHIAQLKAEVWN